MRFMKCYSYINSTRNMGINELGDNEINLVALLIKNPGTCAAIGTGDPTIV